MAKGEVSGGGAEREGDGVKACDHVRQYLRGDEKLPCATPGCPEGFAGIALVTCLMDGQSIATAGDFGRIYIGPNGFPVRGTPALRHVEYERRRNGSAWELFEARQKHFPEVTAQEACERAWRKHELCATGTDE